MSSEHAPLLGRSEQLILSFGTFFNWDLFFFQHTYAIMHLIPSGLVWTEISVFCNRPINQLKPVQQNRQQELRAYCPNEYTVIDLHNLLLPLEHTLLMQNMMVDLLCIMVAQLLVRMGDILSPQRYILTKLDN